MYASASTNARSRQQAEHPNRADQPLRAYVAIREQSEDKNGLAPGSPVSVGRGEAGFQTPNSNWSIGPVASLRRCMEANTNRKESRSPRTAWFRLRLQSRELSSPWRKSRLSRQHRRGSKHLRPSSIQRRGEQESAARLGSPA